MARKYQLPNVHGRYQTVYQKLKRIPNPDTDSENMQSGHTDGIWHKKMCHVNNEKRKTSHEVRKKQEKKQNARKKGNLQILENIGSV